MYCKFETITPEKAAKMLENNPNYRRVDNSRVISYARKMEQGMWQENGEAIQIAEDGSLLNGQHRLHAIIKCGIPQKMLIVCDVNANVFDSGKNRTWTDYTRANNNGKPIDTAIGGATGLIVGDGHLHNPEERFKYVQAHKDDLDKALIFCRRGSHYTPLKKSSCVAAIYCAIMLKLMDDKKIETFCQIVNTGFPCENYANEPALALRNQLAEMKSHGSSSQIVLFEITWQALESFKRGLKSRRAFKPNGCMKDITRQVKNLDTMEENK